MRHVGSKQFGNQLWMFLMPFKGFFPSRAIAELRPSETSKKPALPWQVDCKPSTSCHSVTPKFSDRASRR